MTGRGALQSPRHAPIVGCLDCPRSVLSFWSLRSGYLLQAWTRSCLPAEANRLGIQRHPGIECVDSALSFWRHNGIADADLAPAFAGPKTKPLFTWPCGLNQRQQGRGEIVVSGIPHGQQSLMFNAAACDPWR